MCSISGLELLERRDRMKGSGGSIGSSSSRRPIWHLATNTLWQLVDKVLRLLATLVVGIWVARYLGPLQFGELNYAAAIASLLTPLCDVGLTAIVIRDLVARPQDRPRILASAFVLKLVASLVVCSIWVAVLLGTHDAIQNKWVLALIVSALVAQAWDVIDFDFQSRSYSRPIVLVRCVSLIVFSAIRLWLIHVSAGVEWFAAAVLGEACLSALLMRIVIISRGDATALAFATATKSEMLMLLRRAWPMAVAGLSVILYMRVDQVMLGQMLGSHAVGVFSAAVRISECWFFVPVAILAAVGPSLTASYQSVGGAYERQLRMFIRLLVTLGLAAAITIVVLAPWIILKLYGPDYVEAVPVLRLHAWAGVFASLGVSTGPWFLNLGMTKTRMMHTMLGALVNIALNLVLIPRFGVLGCATATLISYSLAGLWFNLFLRSTRPVFALVLRAMWFE